LSAGIIALSGQQVRDFLADSLDGTGPCRVADSLPWTALAATSVVPGARLLMEELAGGGARLTAKGNLSRKLVETLMDRSRWPGRDPAEIRSICKVINEQDFGPAMYLHAILKVAGLARRSAGCLKLTRKGSALLPEEAAGALHAALLRTTFTRYNLGYLDRLDAPDIYAPQISLILFLIGQFCTDWRPADELMRSVTLPMEEMIDPQRAWIPEFAFTNRVLRYLCWFGLLDEARPTANDNRSSPRLFRKTPLYDRTLSFALR